MWHLEIYSHEKYINLNTLCVYVLFDYILLLVSETWKLNGHDKLFICIWRKSRTTKYWAFRTIRMCVLYVCVCFYQRLSMWAIIIHAFSVQRLYMHAHLLHQFINGLMGTKTTTKKSNEAICIWIAYHNQIQFTLHIHTHTQCRINDQSSGIKRDFVFYCFCLLLLRHTITLKVFLSYFDLSFPKCHTKETNKHKNWTNTQAQIIENRMIIIRTNNCFGNYWMEGVQLIKQKQIKGVLCYKSALFSSILYPKILIMTTGTWHKYTNAMLWYV